MENKIYRQYTNCMFRRKRKSIARSKTATQLQPSCITPLFFIVNYLLSTCHYHGNWFSIIISWTGILNNLIWIQTAVCVKQLIFAKNHLLVFYFSYRNQKHSDSSAISHARNGLHCPGDNVIYSWRDSFFRWVCIIIFNCASDWS